MFHVKYPAGKMGFRTDGASGMGPPAPVPVEGWYGGGQTRFGQEKREGRLAAPIHTQYTHERVLLTTVNNINALAHDTP